MRNKRGITLIALIITIIVLLILSGVSISLVVGENGIISKASKSKIEYAHAEVKEAIGLEYSNYLLEKNQEQTIIDLIGYLKDIRNIITETEEEGKYKIDVEKLLNKTSSLGTGTNGKNVYMLEKITGEANIANLGKIASIKLIKLADTTSTSVEKYKVIYYGNTESENEEIETLSDVIEPKSGNIVFRIYKEFVGEENFQEFTAKEGMTWGELVEVSSYFEVYNDQFIRLTDEGEKLLGVVSSDTCAIFDIGTEGPPVTVDEQINPKTKYIMQYMGG